MKKALFLCGLLICATSIIAQGDIKPEVVPLSGDHVMKGGTYKAKIVPTSKKQAEQTRVFINGKEIKGNVYKASATTPGPKSYSGYVLVGNDTTKYPFKGSYVVGEPSISISRMDEQPFYRYVENTLNIAVPGIPANQLSVECTNAELIPGRAGQYTIIPTDSIAKICKVTVSATLDGKKIAMGSEGYSIKECHPSVYLSNSKNAFNRYPQAEEDLAEVTKSILLNPAYELVPEIPNFTSNQGKMEITQFSIRFPMGNEIVCLGKTFSEEARQRIQALGTGSVILIHSIQADSHGHAIYAKPLVLIVK